ncbi:MAG: aminopeptidase P N-terminal domain-containing protein [Bacteroidota bacterium]
MKNLLVLGLICSSIITLAQDYPSDFLNTDFHKERRAELRELMPANSVAVFFAAAKRNRANDVDFIYHQDPNFYYLTGYKEPGSVFFLFSDAQNGPNGEFNEILFTQRRNARRELYDGPRLGIEGAKDELGFTTAYDATQFREFNIDLDVFDKIFFFDFKDDVRDDPNNDADLYDLILQFKYKADYPVDFNADKYKMYDYIKSDDFLTNPQANQILRRVVNSFPEFESNEKIKAILQAKSPEERELLIDELPEPNPRLDANSLQGYMATLREVKTEAEVDLLRKAITISCVGQREVMKAMRPGMSETEVQGIHEFVFKKYGAEYEGYPSIVGAGNNGCTLHYIKNDKLELGKELVLMDLGAEYRGYTADITRTIPANGKFTKEQKAIYDLVYKAQEEAFKNCKPGAMIRENTQICRDVANQGLYELGIIDSPDAEHNYFPHGVSHHIGLDVHDPGNYEEFAPNMVLTVEPGIYIPIGSDCDKKWWGIGIRIEDDILITEDGYELLSWQAPRTTEEIEALMAEDNIFSKYVLPELESEIKKKGE